MSRISVKDAVKRYGNNTVIPDLNLEIGDGELFTLLGPSGCGKTTLLRMIAGFNSIEGGDIFFNEKRINDMDPASATSAWCSRTMPSSRTSPSGTMWHSV